MSFSFTIILLFSILSISHLLQLTFFLCFPPSYFCLLLIQHPNRLSSLFSPFLWLFVLSPICSFFTLFVEILSAPSSYSLTIHLFFLSLLLFLHFLIFSCLTAHLLYLLTLAGSSRFWLYLFFPLYTPTSIAVRSPVLFMRKRERETGGEVQEGGVGGSLKSFNEPVLTLMTGWVSDGKLICLRERESETET